MKSESGAVVAPGLRSDVFALPKEPSRPDS
jgi:hypothetical protein